MPIWWMLGCQRRPIQEPQPLNPFSEAENIARTIISDPQRNGPVIHPGASPLPPFLYVDRSLARYVGVNTCSACHPSAAEVWRNTAHAHSIKTLENALQSHNPSCLRCHVTGLGHPGGFPEKDNLINVGCEACHGPGSEHVTDPMAGYGELPDAPAACVGCHTHDNSPAFRWEPYWSAIAHSKEPSQSQNQE